MAEKNKKEIWIVAYHFGSVKAGPVIRFIRYAKFFQKQGYEVVFYTKSPGKEPNTSVDNLNCIYLDCNSAVTLTKKALRIATKCSTKPSAIIFFTVSYKNYIDFRAATGRGLCLIYVSTMKLDVEHRSGLKRSKLRKKLLSLVLKKVYGLMTYIVSSTSSLQKDFIDLSIETRSLRVIPNGVNCLKFKPVVEERRMALREQLKIPRSTFVFLYVGLFVDRKGVLELLELFSNFRNSTRMKFLVLMVGHEMDMDENSQYFNETWPKAKGIAMQQGWLVTHSFSDKIEQYYQLADVFVFNSKLEGMPNVLLEAMSSGLPTVTSRFKGFCADYGKPNLHYLIFENDRAKDIGMLNGLQTNQELQATLGRQARSKVQRDFDIEMSIQKYIALFTNHK